MIAKKIYLRFSNLFDFEDLIAPYLIKLIYRIGILIILGGGVLSCINSAGVGGSIGRVLLAFGGTLLSLLLWRVVSELWILAFKIFQRLGEIKDLLTLQNSASMKSREE